MESMCNSAETVTHSENKTRDPGALRQQYVFTQILTNRLDSTKEAGAADRQTHTQQGVS